MRYVKRLLIVVVIAALALALLLGGCVVAGVDLPFLTSLGLSKLYYQLEYEDYIASASKTYDVDPYLIAAIIKCESNFDADAVSSASSEGLMQLSADAASDMVKFGFVDATVYDPDDLFDPETNIYYGTAYLSYLLARYDGDEQAAIAAYNGGLQNADNWVAAGGSLADAITFAETRTYLADVLAAEEAYRNGYPDVFDS
jgi:soluble lytic murein transglycosylase